MKFLWSRLQRDVEDLGKHNVHTHFLKDRNCKICKRTKITRAPCRRRNGEAVPRAANFGDLITADHKVLRDNCESRNNHRYAVVVQDLATRWIQAYPCKKQNFTRNQEKLAKVPGTERKPKVIYTDNSLEFGKACEDLSWNHCTSTSLQSETNGIAERAVRRVKEDTSAVKSTSPTTENDYENCVFTARMSTRAMRTSMRQTTSTTSTMTRTPTRAKGDVLIADLEGLETMDASEIYSKTKEVIFPKQGEFIFPIEDGRIKTPGGDQELRTSTLVRPRPIQGESHIDFLGESEGSLPQP